MLHFLLLNLTKQTKNPNSYLLLLQGRQKMRFNCILTHQAVSAAFPRLSSTWVAISGPGWVANTSVSMWEHTELCFLWALQWEIWYCVSSEPQDIVKSGRKILMQRRLWSRTQVSLFSCFSFRVLTWINGSNNSKNTKMSTFSAGHETIAS